MGRNRMAGRLLFHKREAYPEWSRLDALVAKLNAAAILTNTYDAADQVVGWTYDNAGNLTNDAAGGPYTPSGGRRTG